MRDDSLDPADWDVFRRLAHQALDHAIDAVAHVRERPAWQAPPKRTEGDALPWEPTPLPEVCAAIERDVLPFGVGNTHPRFFGWVHGAGTAEGIVAAIYTAAMNANVGGREHAAVHVEREVLGWFKQLVGFPQSAQGILLSGTSMATMIALAVARHGSDDKFDAFRIYTSDQAHISVAKAVRMLGLPRSCLVEVRSDEHLRMDAGALREALDQDRAAGLVPLAVVATAGTALSGAVDPLQAICEICRSSALWLHVDAAIGIGLRLHPALRERLVGIEDADSVAFDAHKWLHVPYDVGCVLVRDAQAHRAAFREGASYLQRAARGTGSGDPWFCDAGPELSRGFRALKVWMVLKTHGLAALGEQVLKNCVQAQEFAARIDACEEAVVVAPTDLAITCFRCVGAGRDDADDRLNDEIVVRVQESGVAVPSSARVHGRAVIRVNITNHRTTSADLDLLLEAVLGHRAEILGEG
ncbi:MAG: aminotransferase class V-fold PLP-dependent enzyme [Nannocystaceae bacterium]|nr:aminotransferase class V-fold PLP-dependent enzyme [Nannocystaceae bacterium]